MQGLNIKNTTQQVHIEVLNITLTKVNEYEDYVEWRHDYKTIWTDERLKWPTECQNTEPKKNTPDFVKSELLDILWNPIIVFSDIAATKKPTCQSTLKITQVNFYNQISYKSVDIK